MNHLQMLRINKNFYRIDVHLRFKSRLLSTATSSKNETKRTWKKKSNILDGPVIPVIKKIEKHVKIDAIPQSNANSIKHNLSQLIKSRNMIEALKYWKSLLTSKENVKDIDEGTIFILLTGLESIRRWKLIYALYHRCYSIYPMNRSIKIHSSLGNLITKSLMTLKKYDLVKLVLNDMRERNIVETVTYAGIIKNCHGQEPLVMEFYHLLMKEHLHFNDPVATSSILLMISPFASTEQILSYFHRVKNDKGIDINHITMMMKYFFMKRDVTKMMSIYSLIESEKIEMTSYKHMLLLLKSLLNAKQINEALPLFAYIKEQSQSHAMMLTDELYETFIKYYYGTHDTVNVEKMVQELISLHIPLMNSASFTTILDICIKIQRVDLAEAVYHKVREVNMQCFLTSNNYSGLLFLHLLKNDYTNAYKLLQLFQQDKVNLTETKVMGNNVLKILCHFNQRDDAMKVFTKLRDIGYVDQLHYRYLLQLYVHHQEYDKALELYRLLKRDKIESSIILNNIIREVLIVTGHYDEADDVFEQCIQSNQVDMNSYVQMMRLYTSKDETRSKVTSIYQKLKKNMSLVYGGTKESRSLFRILHELGYHDDIYQLLYDLNTKKIQQSKPSINSTSTATTTSTMSGSLPPIVAYDPCKDYSFVTLLYIVHQQYIQGYLVYEQFKSLKLPLDRLTGDRFMQLLCANRKYDEVLSIFSTLRKQNLLTIYHFATFMKAMSDNQDVTNMTKLYTLMIKDQISLQVKSDITIDWNETIEVSPSQYNSKNAVTQHNKETSISNTDTDINKSIDSSTTSNEDDNDEIDTIVTKEILPTTQNQHPGQSILSSLLSCGLIKQSIEHLQRLSALHIADLHDFINVIQRCIHLNYEFYAYNVYSILKEYNSTYPTRQFILNQSYVCNMILKVLLLNRKYTEADTLFQEMRRMNIHDYNTYCIFMRRYREKNQYEKAYKYLRLLLLEENLPISTHRNTGNHALDIYIHMNKDDEAWALFQTMRHNNLTNKTTYFFMLHGYFRLKNTKLTSIIYDIIIQDRVKIDSILGNTMLLILLQNGLYTKALELFDDMRQWKVQSDVNYAVLMKSFAESGQRDIVKRLHTQLLSDNIIIQNKEAEKIISSVLMPHEKFEDIPKIYEYMLTNLMSTVTLSSSTGKETTEEHGEGIEEEQDQEESLEHNAEHIEQGRKS